MKLRCAVVFGGRSDEHNASVHTAATIFRYFVDDDAVEMVPLYISPSGGMFLPEITDVTALPNIFDVDLSHLEVRPCKMTFHYGVLVITASVITASKEHLAIHPNVVYPLIPGATGEAGEIYALLSFFAVPTVGPDFDVSSLLFNKVASKQIFDKLEMPTLPCVDVFQTVETEIDHSEIIEIVSASFGVPCVVKPARQGSSIGLQICTEANEIGQAVDRTLEHDNRAIIEPLLTMTEYCCYAWRSDDGVKVSTVMSTSPVGGVYDFNQKYIEKSGVLFAYKGFESAVVSEIRESSRKIYSGLNGRGLWRLDFFVEPDQTIFINEVNTVPALINVYGNTHPLNSESHTIKDVVSEMMLHALNQHIVS